MNLQIILDTETTGLSVEQGHRLIQNGCVGMKNRPPGGKNFSSYGTPQAEVSAAPYQGH